LGAGEGLKDLLVIFLLGGKKFKNRTGRKGKKLLRANVHRYILAWVRRTNVRKKAVRRLRFYSDVETWGKKPQRKKTTRKKNKTFFTKKVLSQASGPNKGGHT